MIQVGILGYVVSLLVCAIVILRTNDLTPLNIVAVFWGVVGICYGMRLIMRRQGLVPTRTGMRMLSSRGAVICGALYVALGCVFVVVAWILFSMER